MALFVRSAGGVRAVSAASIARASLLLCAVVACDIPTGVPTWNQTWVVPGDSTQVSVSELLPKSGEVTVVTAGSTKVFSLAVPAPPAISTSLGQVCPVCVSANGTTVSKPAFTLRDSTSTTLPSDLVSAAITSGSLAYTITNGFSFDPLRPNAAGAPYGYLVVRVMNGTTVVASDSVDGQTTAMGKNGATFQRTLAFNAVTVSGASPLRVVITLDSPQGDAITINTSESFSLAAQPGQVTLGQATVKVQSQSIAGQQTSIDLSSVDASAVVNRVQGGALRLTVANPFGVQGQLDAVITAAGMAPITKTIVLSSSATSTPRVDLTADELRAMLGKSVTLTVGGVVSSPSGTVTLDPTQVLKVKSDFELTISTTEG